MALVGRLLCLALISAGLGTATLTTLEPAAAAAAADGPTAIAVGPAGTSYVGFADGRAPAPAQPEGPPPGQLCRSTRTGRSTGSSSTRAGQIWVDYGTSVSLLAPGGRVLAALRPRPGALVRRQPGDAVRRHHRRRRPGVGGQPVRRHDDRLHARAAAGSRPSTCPGETTRAASRTAPPSPVAVRLSTSRSPTRAGSSPTAPIGSAARPGPGAPSPCADPAGGARPSPAGLAVDRFGQLTVADLANNAIFLLDTNHDFNVYRTLGHPPRASRAVGRLSGPSAIAQYAQDGGSLSGNLFIADTGNRRVQRWNTSGWTYWANAGPGRQRQPGRAQSSVGPPPGRSSPSGLVNTAPPAVVGAGRSARRSPARPAAGRARGLSGYSYAWSRNGVPIAHTASSKYVVLNADVGSRLGCTVTATDGGGSATAARPGA